MQFGTLFRYTAEGKFSVVLSFSLPIKVGRGEWGRADSCPRARGTELFWTVGSRCFAKRGKPACTQGSAPVTPGNPRLLRY